ncbi:tRNA pseudouridine(55) synthase TruB [Amphibacillus sp. Q70]|uniref:tRNA pseudouridine(55) synthase TruB n=1 Tax=Amphibacillus sp. Q70 TaxID=3453416 RepID=UPI003F877AFE
MNGIVPLWKPKGMTSHDCVMKLRRIFATKKVGHTGTLDPEVEGVLPICIGEATKIVPYLTDTRKTYQAEITLGIATDTEDQTGTMTQAIPVEEQFTEDKLTHVLNQFKGEIDQLTPLYSAVKVNGKKLYQYARANQPVERPMRRVTIHSINYLAGTLEYSNQLAKFSIIATVSKGTYIRTLAVDIGASLGYPAHMSHLVRTETADFNQRDAVTFEQLELLQETDQLASVLVPIEAGLTHLPSHQISRELAEKVSHGQKLPRPVDWLEDQPYRLAYNGQTLAVYQVHPEKKDQIKPLRVFNLTE